MNMNLEDMRSYQKGIEWKVVDCPTGPECWCKMIVTPEYDPEVQSDESIVFGSAAIPKDLAYYITELHNNKLKNQ